jgi:tRNA(adenine34) deaminase
MNNRIIAKAHNQVELLTDSTAHAEIMALTTAFSFWAVNICLRLLYM